MACAPSHINADVRCAAVHGANQFRAFIEQLSRVEDKPKEFEFTNEQLEDYLNNRAKSGFLQDEVVL